MKNRNGKVWYYFIMKEDSVKIRTRFAPSPTGYIHIGNVRTALYTYLASKSQGGEMLLRVEDTDQARFVEGAEKLVLETLQWLGITWDGEVTRQTERREIYLEYAKKLIDRGLAYADPYTPEEVEKFRQQANKEKKPFLYRDFRPENPPKWQPGMPLRFKVENPKKYTWQDEVYGELSAGPEALDDFILIKSDGLPTYNFAHIVDDDDMGVNLIIRGQEYISSMPRYLSLYDALGIKWPTFAHLPHILNETGNKKLGKRDGAKSVEQYREEGYLPEAIVNFLAELGWNDGTEQDIYSMDELLANFTLTKVHKSSARFDEKRLNWLNGQWIQRLELDNLYERTQGFWGESAHNATTQYKKDILELAQPRMKTLRDLPSLTSFFFTRPQADLAMLDEDKQLKKLGGPERAELLQATRNKLEGIGNSIWNIGEIQTALNELLEETNQKPAILFSLIRYTLTWTPFSPGLPETMVLLGKEETLARINSDL